MSSRLLAAVALMLAAALMIAGCPGPKTGAPEGESMPPSTVNTPETSNSAAGAAGTVINAKGSDTLLQVAQALAEEYRKTKPDVQINVAGGGSGTGFTAIVDGTCDIADASRKIKDEEVKKCQEKGFEPVENIVGYDGICVIVNKANPIEKLTIDQLSDLFVGQTPDWKALGGKGEVVLLSRDSTSGTYEYFKEHVIQKGDKKSTRDFAAAAQRLQSNEQIRDQVASTENAIGYIGMGYLNDSVKAVPIVDKNGKPVLPNTETVRSGDYPISRPLFMYTRKDAPAAITEYIEWIKTEGQKTVEKQGFVPLK
jgi:phosphate transport system substrate-binding protein